MSFESPRSNLKEKKNEDDLLVHDLIRKEFRDLIENDNYEIPYDTEAIMVISAPPNLNGKTKEEIEETLENVKRIDLGIEIYKKIIAQKLNKNISDINQEDLKNKLSPLLVLNGDTEQLVMMERVTLSRSFPLEKIKLINCGDRSIANTKTQFEKTAEDPIVGKFKHITFITTSYHIPRLARTASVLLPKNQNFEIIGIPYKDYPFDIYKKVKGEVKRIINYSQKGDISRDDLRNKK